MSRLPSHDDVLSSESIYHSLSSSTVRALVEADASIRAERFQKFRDRKPQPGEVIRTKDGLSVPVYVDLKPDFGKGPTQVMFTNALIDRECTGWYLTKEVGRYCLKVLILPHSQRVLIEANGGSERNLKVEVLRVVRHNAKGTALICEVLVEDE